MRVLYSSQSDPMILDSAGGLNKFHRRLLRFLAIDQRVLRVETAVSGSPAPYEEFLSGLVIEKSDGPVLVAQGQDCALTIHGSVENLSIYAKYFHFCTEEDGTIGSAGPSIPRLAQTCAVGMSAERSSYRDEDRVCH